MLKTNKTQERRRCLGSWGTKNRERSFVLSFSCRESIKKRLSVSHFLSGARDETRTHNPVREADFKSAAYTNSATRASINIFWRRVPELHWSTRFCRPLRNCSANAPCDYYITGKSPNHTGRGLYYSLRSLSAMGMARGAKIVTVATSAYCNWISAARLISHTATT